MGEKRKERREEEDSSLVLIYGIWSIIIFLSDPSLCLLSFFSPLILFLSAYLKGNLARVTPCKVYTEKMLLWLRGRGRDNTSAMGKICANKAMMTCSIKWVSEEEKKTRYRLSKI